MIQYSAQSREWLNANMSRAYPFDDRTGGAVGALPGPALVDGFILTTGFEIEEGTAEWVFYVSGIDNTGSSVLLSITAARGNDLVVFSNAVAIHDIDDFAVIEFSAHEDSYTICGSFTVGLASVLRSIPSNTSLSPESAKIAPYIIHRVDGLCVTGIRVGDTLLTGEVTLAAGDGIELVPNGNTIVISALNYQPPPENLAVIDDRTLVTKLVELYGRPVLSVAGVRPNCETGAIRIQGASESTTTSNASNVDYVVPVPGADGSGVLYLKLDRDPMLDKDYIVTLTTNLTQLDQRLGKVDSTITAVDKVVASVATQLTRLG